MTDIFAFSSYKDFVQNWVQSQPKAGRGQYKKMAEHLGVGTVLISQVFKGDRNLSEDQALELTIFLNLLEVETQYFLILVRIERAASVKLKQHLTRELNALREQTKKLKGRIKSQSQLNEEDKAIFYSNWSYSAIRLATDVPDYSDVNSLSQRFGLPTNQVKNIVEFLVRTGLCVIEDGRLAMGPSIVFLEGESPYALPRQRGWRIKSFERMEAQGADDFFFTCPLVCSKSTADKIRNDILKFTQHILKSVEDSPSEEVACLNIDWFKF